MKVEICLGLLLAYISHVSAQICNDLGGDQFCVYANDDGSSVKFRYEAPSGVGWVAFGPGSGMSAADIVVAWPNPDKTVTIGRRHVSGYQLPTYMAGEVTPVPEESGVQMVNGVEKMVATFTRSKTQLSDLPDSLAISGSAQSIIWGAHATENPGSTDPASPFAMHTVKASVPSVNILDAANTYSGESPAGTGPAGDPASSPVVSAPVVSPTRRCKPRTTPTPETLLDETPLDESPLNESPLGDAFTVSSPAAETCIQEDQQCAGSAFIGTGSCCEGLKCEFQTVYYSQCRKSS